MSEIITDKLTGRATAGDVTITDGSATMKLQDGVSKSYIWYDQSVPETDVSFNMSSVTDHSVGQFTLNYTNNFDTATYVWLVGGQDSRVTAVNPTSGYVTSSTTRFATRIANTAALSDLNNNTVAVQGDLA